MELFRWIAVLAAGYFLGNLNGALITSKLMMHDDVRAHGSGNAGLTNFFRTYGGFQSLLVIAIDVLKCVLACLIARWVVGGKTAEMAAGLACIIGHSFPVLAGFRGGKGILSGAAVGLMIDLRIFTIIMTIFFIAVIATRYVSFGSILAASSFGICVLVFYWGQWPLCILAVAASSLVVFRHRANLVRLVKGTESKLSFHKK